MVVNYPESIVFLVLFLIHGIISLFFPIRAVKIMSIWPKFIISKFFQNEGVTPTVQKALQLIDEDPEEYVRQFRGQLLLTRFSGAFTLLLSFIVLLAVLIDYLA